MTMRPLLPAALLLSALSGEEAAIPVAAEPAAEAPSPWTWKTKLGFFFKNVSSHNAENSRDPSIAGSTDTVSWTASGAGQLIYQEDVDRVEQNLEATYGRVRTQGQDGWSENTDRIFYAVTWERTISAPQFAYLGGTAESAFTGPEPDEEPLEPIIVKASAGYGHRYSNLLPESDSLMWRLGIYARKRWQKDAPDYQTRVDSGPEALIRYERQQNPDISYHLQGETLGDFDDPDHFTNILQAGLSIRIAKLLTVEIKARAYYETRPREAARDEPGYSQWSVRQEALIGLVWEMGSG